MKIINLRPQLYTADLKTTLEFYTINLDFRVLSYNEKWNWMSLQHNGVEWMFTTPDHHRPFDKCIMTGSIYLDVSDVDYWWNKLKDKVEIAYPVETFEYGMREFAFYDNNGYMIQMGMSI